MKTKNNQKENTGKKVALVGAGIVAIAAAAYFLSGKKNQKAIKSWMIKMKAEAIEKLEKSNDLTKEAYENIIDTISQKYHKLSTTDSEEVAQVVADLKKKWNGIKRDLKNIKSAKKVSKKK